LRYGGWPQRDRPIARSMRSPRNDLSATSTGIGVWLRRSAPIWAQKPCRSGRVRLSQASAGLLGGSFRFGNMVLLLSLRAAAVKPHAVARRAIRRCRRTRRDGGESAASGSSALGTIGRDGLRERKRRAEARCVGCRDANGPLSLGHRKRSRLAAQCPSQPWTRRAFTARKWKSRVLILWRVNRPAA
jgi:hypothetical protein